MAGVRCCVLILLATVLLSVGCRTPGEAWVRVHLASDGRDLGGLRSLAVDVESVGLHPAGMRVEEGWVAWPAAQGRVDLVALSPGAGVLVGEARVPAGRYDRVRVVVGGAQAWGTGGDPVAVRVTVEPIAAPFTLRSGQRARITIELIALARPDGGYELFTKDVTITGE